MSPQVDILVATPEVDVVLVQGEVEAVIEVASPEVEVVAEIQVGVIGPMGPPGADGAPGADGTGDLNYTHIQNSPSLVWNVSHGLGKFPSVTIVDSGGSEVEGFVQHLDNDNLTITLSYAVSGKAFVN